MKRRFHKCQDGAIDLDQVETVKINAIKEHIFEHWWDGFRQKTVENIIGYRLDLGLKSGASVCICKGTKLEIEKFYDNFMIVLEGVDNER
jgi:hypothetical protein